MKHLETIQLNISTAFHNKPSNPDDPAIKAAFGNSFKPACIDLAQFVDHITSGNAWTLHLFKGNRRHSNYWISSQLLALDLDDSALTTAELAAIPFIHDYAYLVYPSPSSTPEKPKSRIVFVLSEPVTEAQRWKALQLGLLGFFADLSPDAKCKDLARLFYGSTQPGHIVLGNRLPIEIAGSLTVADALADLSRFFIAFVRIGSSMAMI